MKNNCLVIVGERSGEEHALSFFNQLKEKAPTTHFWGVGGDNLKKLGVELIYHLDGFSTFGFSEAIGKIFLYKKRFNKILQEVDARNCKVAILVDFQTFNLHLARYLKARGVAVLYFVAPTAWAWKAYRSQVLQKTVHTLFTIFPFEKEWFLKRGVQRIKSVQHPFLRTYRQELKESQAQVDGKFPADTIRLLLLPGSRNFEVAGLLPLFLQAVNRLSDYRFQLGLVPCPNVSEHLYAPYLHCIDETFNPDEELASALQWADVALAASGTVVLACALFSLPTVVAYSMRGLVDQFVVDHLIKYKGFKSLPNLIHQKELLPELYFEQCSAYNCARELERWIKDETLYRAVKKELSLTFNLMEKEDADAGYYMAEVINNAYKN